MTVCLIIHLFCKSCEHEIVFVLICTLAEQSHVRKSYKMRESTMLCIGNLEENINLSHIYLAVQLGKYIGHGGMCERIALKSLSQQAHAPPTAEGRWRRQRA